MTDTHGYRHMHTHIHTHTSLGATTGVLACVRAGAHDLQEPPHRRTHDHTCLLEVPLNLHFLVFLNLVRCKTPLEIRVQHAQLGPAAPIVARSGGAGCHRTKVVAAPDRGANLGRIWWRLMQSNRHTCGMRVSDG